MVRSALLLVSPVLLAALLAASLRAGTVQTPATATAPVAPPQGAAANYYCIVHPDVNGPAPGLCRKCGNPLFEGDPWAQPDYLVDLRTEPRAPRHGRPVDIRVAILDAASRAPVIDFNVIQDRRLHLVIVSQDATHFAHLHPEQQPDGSWTVSHVLTRPGFYRAFVRFSPFGGLPQVLARTFATAAYAGDLAAPIPPDVAGRAVTQVVGGTRVQLTLEPAPVRAGPTTKLRYEFTAGGAPVTDLEPYDGSWGQAVVLSDDAVDFVGADAIEGVPADVVDPRGGPQLRFDVIFPRAGRYRTWLQFKRRGVVWTAPFTVEVLPRGTPPR